MLIVEHAICKGGLGDSSYMSIAKYACRQLPIMSDNGRLRGSGMGRSVDVTAISRDRSFRRSGIFRVADYTSQWTNSGLPTVRE